MVFPPLIHNFFLSCLKSFVFLHSQIASKSLPNGSAFPPYSDCMNLAVLQIILGIKEIEMLLLECINMLCDTPCGASHKAFILYYWEAKPTCRK